MNLKDLRNYIEEDIRKHPFQNEPESLSDPLNYITDLGGKRARPLLLLSTYLCFEDDINDDILLLARSIEMFHNFSLIHDDVMDASELRRGQATVHIKWDTSTAILSGDLMLIKVYQNLHQLGNSDIIKAFDQMAERLCEGQMLDMEFEERSEVSGEEYLKMIEGKTAVLLAFATSAAGSLANQNKDMVNSLHLLGINLGMAFQLRDDYLDSFGDAENFGKLVGQDILKRKKTYLWNYMYAALTVEERAKLDNWPSGDKEGLIAHVKQLMDQTGAKRACEEKINAYHTQVQDTLNELKKSFNTSLLEQLIAMLEARVQ